MTRRGSTASPLLLAGATCLALALASLALPTGPTYDPYSWLIWGRDLAHLGLSTTGTGTSWKPLPALVDAFLTPLGRGAADGWVLVARAGALFAVFMAFRLAWRLAPSGGRVLAGTVAAAALVLTHEWVRRTGVGEAEGLMVAFVLLAIDRHLDGHPRQAFALIVTAGLVRVEMWPFALVYGAWLWRQSPSLRVRTAIAAALLVLPLCWFGGDWAGSGHLTTAADRALQPKRGTPGASAHPAVAVLSEALSMVPLSAWVALAVALVWAALRRNRVLTVLAGGALAWTAIIAVMAQRGYAGLPRYLWMACAIEAVLAGVGVAVIVAGARRHTSALTPLVTALVLAGFAIGAVPHARRLPADIAAVDKVADMDAVIARSVREAGGGVRVMRCGDPATRWFIVPALAWDLDVQATAVRLAHKGPLVEACRRGILTAKPT